MSNPTTPIYDAPTPTVFQKYAKAFVAAAGTASLVTAALAAGDFTTVQGVIGVVGAVLTTLGVRQVTNRT